jgi:hypothetical protein
VVWSTAKPRSAISSSRFRRLRENLQYHRTQVTIMTGSNLRLRNDGGRLDLIPSTYQMRRCNTSVLLDLAISKCQSMAVLLRFLQAQRQVNQNSDL